MDGRTFIMTSSSMCGPVQRVCPEYYPSQRPRAHDGGEKFPPGGKPRDHPARFARKRQEFLAKSQKRPGTPVALVVCRGIGHDISTHGTDCSWLRTRDWTLRRGS